MLIYFFAYCDSLFWLTFLRCSCKLGRLKQFSALLIYSSPFHLMYKSLTIYVSNFTDPKADCEGNFFFLQGLLLLTRCSCEASSTDFLKCSIWFSSFIAKCKFIHMMHTLFFRSWLSSLWKWCHYLHCQTQQVWSKFYRFPIFVMFFSIWCTNLFNSNIWNRMSDQN